MGPRGQVNGVQQHHELARRLAYQLALAPDDDPGLVRDLGGRSLPAGISEWVWDGRDRNGSVVPPGVYFIRAEGGGRATSRQLVLLRD